MKIPEWKCEITKVDNGYTLTHKEEIDDHVYKTVTRVINEDDSQYGDLEAMKELMYEIQDYFAVVYNKHAKKNLYIEVRDEEED